MHEVVKQNKYFITKMYSRQEAGIILLSDLYIFLKDSFLLQKLSHSVRSFPVADLLSQYTSSKITLEGRRDYTDMDYCMRLTCHFTFTSWTLSL